MIPGAVWLACQWCGCSTAADPDALAILCESCMDCDQAVDPGPSDADYYEPAANDYEEEAPACPAWRPDVYLLTIKRDGYTRGEWRYPKWALCHSDTVGETNYHARKPAKTYRNGGPVALVRPSAGKDAPQWQRRAVAYVDAVGGLSLPELEAVAIWYQGHRVGSYPGAEFAAAAK